MESASESGSPGRFSSLRGWARGVIPTGSGFESRRFLAKWLILGTLIGIVAGLGAVLFSHAIRWATEFFLGYLVGYQPPMPIGEGSPTIGAMTRPWLLPIVTMLGGLISGIIVFSLAPEAEGHGTDAAIDAIHHKNGRLRARIPPIKLFASAITIGSGGSGGREGPAAQISAGFGSLLGNWLKLDPRDRRIAVAAGMGAGIGAIFRAPLGGALMAAEILYIHDLEVEALIPGLISSIVGYSIFGAIEGWQPIFGSQPGLAFQHPITLVYYAALGILCGAVGLLYAKSFYGTQHVFHHLHLPNWFKPALGGLLVGLIGLEVRGALHTGYGWVQIGMSPEVLTLPLWIVLVLPFAKILATSLSIGSGGSGGIFGPGMVIGGMLGAAVWRLSYGHLPMMPASSAPFVIIGMMALFGGIAHAPLAVMLMVAEMTGNLSLLAPAMVAVAFSTALVGDVTIYRSQLPDRSSSPAHRLRFSFPLLSSLFVRDAMKPSPVEIMNGNRDVVLVRPDEPLDQALERLTENGATSATVSADGATIGQLSVRDVFTTYRAAMGRTLDRTRALPAQTRLVETEIAETSPLVGKTLQEADLPAESLVISISRSGETLFPRGMTKIEAGDLLSILTTTETEASLQDSFAASGSDHEVQSPVSV
jgi:chloride channel protein, CIC family